MWLKDYVRHHAVTLVNTGARARQTRALWARTIGLRTSATVTRAGCLFIHVPKTGGTAVSMVLYGRNLPHYTARFYHDVFPALAARTPAFAVVREPVDRFFSAYRFMVQRGTKLMAASRYQPIRVADFRDVDDFAAWAAAHPHMLRRIEQFADQHLFVADQAGIMLVDSLFAMDRLMGLPQGLAGWTGGVLPPRINVTRAAAEQPSRATVAHVRALYAQDVALYERVLAAGRELTGRGRQL